MKFLFISFENNMTNELLIITAHQSSINSMLLKSISFGIWLDLFIFSVSKWNKIRNNNQNSNPTQYNAWHSNTQYMRPATWDMSYTIWFALVSCHCECKRHMWHAKCRVYWKVLKLPVEWNEWFEKWKRDIHFCGFRSTNSIPLCLPRECSFVPSFIKTKPISDFPFEFHQMMEMINTKWNGSYNGSVKIESIIIHKMQSLSEFHESIVGSSSIWVSSHHAVFHLNLMDRFMTYDSFIFYRMYCYYFYEYFFSFFLHLAEKATANICNIHYTLIHYTCV